MEYIPMTDYESSPDDIRAEYDDQIAKHGRITNMKRTLLQDKLSFKVYMEWYSLYDELISYGLTDRELTVFSYAISTGNDCLICGMFFTKILVDAGEDPKNLTLSEREKLLVDFGTQITNNPHGIDEEIYEKLRAEYDDRTLTALIAFAGIMYATNLFNTVAKVPLDDVLYSYIKDKREEK